MEPGDVIEAVAACRRTLRPLAGLDWSVRAGELEWSVWRTVSHISDAVGCYAGYLAVRSPHRLRFDVRTHDGATNGELLDVLDTAAALLTQVAAAAEPDARAYHGAGMADPDGFLAMGCDETLVHCWDAARGLGAEFDAPPALAERTVRRLFPWAPTGVPPWPALLWANGRLDLPGRPRPATDWVWHCAPLREWDGTVPRWTTPPSRYEWDDPTRRWRPAR
ncbi:MAG: hypothetical protein ACRDT4_26920 [Micromonosporaceae bacterium]